MKRALRGALKGTCPPPGASDAIQRRLIGQDWWAAAFQAGLYRATPSEPGTGMLWADLQARGVRVACPMSRQGTYRWGWVDAQTRWRSGVHGIPEPAEAEAANPRDLRIIVVPGVAFDVRGGRLGHGRGHFDRLLSPCAGLLVGLCFEVRLVEAVPMEPHDIPVDVVVTEKRMIFAAPAAAKLERLTG